MSTYNNAIGNDIIKNKKKLMENNKSSGVIATAVAVIAVVLAISAVILFSTKGAGPEKTTDPAHTEINILPATGGEAAVEDEYIEYEAPDTSF